MGKTLASGRRADKDGARYPARHGRRRPTIHEFFTAATEFLPDPKQDSPCGSNRPMLCARREIGSVPRRAKEAMT